MSRRDAHFHRDVDNNENKPASHSQRQYVEKLLDELERRGGTLPADAQDIDDLTNQEASELIDELGRLLDP